MRREPGSEIIVKDIHRALWYEDGKLTRVLEAGRYEIPRQPFLGRGPQVDVEFVDMREQELTIKGQEILTADKVSIRVSVLVQYRVTARPPRCIPCPATKTGSTATSSWRLAVRWRL